MKLLKSILFCLCGIILVSNLTAQSADEIITKYVKAIGGKETISKINSLYLENTVEIMGSESVSTTIILNGKGAKTITDMMGQKMIQCYTDKGGWMINPMMGNAEPMDMPLEQYNAGKNQIFISDPVIDYAARGYKVELMGSEMIGQSDHYKIKLTGINELIFIYYFDKQTGFLTKMTMSGKMMGQDMQMITSFQDYQKTEQGIFMPARTEISYNEQFTMVMKTKKMEFNKPIDLNIFNKGNLTY